MRDKQFVAVHRGGSLTKEHQRQLIRWARMCSEHVLKQIGGNIDSRLIHALQIAEEWENNRIPTGDAMKASVGAHAAARESADPVAKAMARSIGHAVATAHMADHSLGGALYALKALKIAGKPLDKEKVWQKKQLHKLPMEMQELLLDTMMVKGKILKI